MERSCSGACEAHKELKRTLKTCSGYFLLSIYLLPLDIASITTKLLSPLYITASMLIEERGAEAETCREDTIDNTLVIPAPILHDVYHMLRTRGGEGNEWIVALGCQEITGKKVAVHAYDLNCSLSTPTSAETDYGSLDSVLEFYELCGVKIVGLAHIHPWNAKDVHPSRIDIETHHRWEEYYDGEFIGIVFTSGVFRIFHGGKCRIRTEILGNGVRKRGENLYELELV